MTTAAVFDDYGRLLYAPDGRPVRYGAACLCAAGCRPAEAHDGRCPGADPIEWRARVPEHLWPEVTRIHMLVPRGEAPIYRALALEYLTTARYGPTGDTDD